MFSTSSLELASAIQATSLSKLQYIDRSNNSGKAEFVFDREKDPNFDEIVQRFWTNNLPIDAATYATAMRIVKARLYETN